MFCSIFNNNRRKKTVKGVFNFPHLISGYLSLLEHMCCNLHNHISKRTYFKQFSCSETPERWTRIFEIFYFIYWCLTFPRQFIWRCSLQTFVNLTVLKLDQITIRLATVNKWISDKLRRTLSRNSTRSWCMNYIVDASF